MEKLKVFELSNEKLFEIGKEIEQIRIDFGIRFCKRTKLLTNLMNVVSKIPIDSFNEVRESVKNEVFKRFITKQIK